MSESNLDFLEDALRKGVKTNRQNLINMFHLFDREGTGYITIDELYKTVTGFIAQMPFPAFQQLMDRLNIRATHTLAWKVFMRKFDPLFFSEQQNGSFLPLRANHRYLPTKGTDQTLSVNTLLTKLCEHIRNGYPSLKDAFLAISDTKGGQVTPSKMKKLLRHQAKIIVNETQVDEIWQLLLPDGSKTMDYSRFVELFEVTETPDSHPWLQSTHKFNDVRHPAPLAGKSGAEIVVQHVTKNWKYIACQLGQADKYKTGNISTDKLKSLIVDVSGPIDSNSFTDWISKCSSFIPKADNTDSCVGTVGYREFFSKLGIEINPGDLQGLSQQIYDENQATLEGMLSDQRNRHQNESNKAAAKANEMSIEEVIVRLRDRFEQKTNGLYKTFLYFAKKKKNFHRLSKNGFKKMLSHMGMLLNNENFEELCNRLHFTGGHMTYDDFYHSFQGLFFQAPSQVERTDNHFFNEIRGGEQVFGADEGYRLFKEKLLGHFPSLEKAYQYADIQKAGVISQPGVRRLFDVLNIPLDPTCMDEIMQKLAAELNKPSIRLISLDEFRNMFEVREDERGHKWTSDHRFNQQREGKFPETAQGMLQMLMLKMKSQFNSPTDAFLAADPKKTGKVRKSDLARLMTKLHMKVEEPLLSQVWDLIDPVREGSVKLESFFAKTGVDNPGDQSGGVSEKIINQSHVTMEEMLAKMKERHQLVTKRQATVAPQQTAEIALETVARKLIDSGLSLDALFAKFDVQKRGFLTAMQIQTILHTYHIFLQPPEEERFMQFLGIGRNGRSVTTLKDFKSAFTDQNCVVGSERQLNDDVSNLNNGNPVEYNMNKLSYHQNVDIWKKTKKMLTRHSDAMQKAFQALDKSNSGRLELADFERVLAIFCGPKLPLQFVRQRFPPGGDGTIDYRSFMGTIVHQNVPAVTAALLLNSNNSSNEQIAAMRRMAHAVRTKHYQLNAACEELDYARVGTLSVRDFRNILQQYTFPISDSLFTFLTSMIESIPFSSDGPVRYREALSHLSTADQTLPMPSGDAIPPSTGEDTGMRSDSTLPPIADDTSSIMSRMSGRAYSTLSTRTPSTIRSSMIADILGDPLDDLGLGGLPMIDASKAETQLYPSLAKKWRRFHRLCRAADQQQTGFLPTPTIDSKNVLQ